MRQTLETIQSDFDRIALLSAEDCNHNERYLDYLLRQLPPRCGRALEIGCGAGAFSRLLAGHAESVLAVDLSPQMIRLARERSRLYTNIEFEEGDVMAREFADEEFDCVASLTTLHHLPMEAVLRKIKRALRPGGVFVCLDLYQRSGLTDLFFDGSAYLLSPLARLLKSGRLKPDRGLREAYEEHGKTDTYLTLPQVERACAEVMPGAVVRRHLFWRYSVVWRKDT